MATISLKLTLDSESNYSGHLVWFIILFPALLLLLFFGTLWIKRESVYSPGDFRDDRSFLRLFEKLETLELQQKAAQVDPRSASKDQALAMEAELIRVGDYGGAAHLLKGFIKVGRDDIATVLLDELASSIAPGEYSDIISSLRDAYPKFLEELKPVPQRHGSGQKD